ncbi:glucose-6-phosphate dehydrogenase [Kineobactrum sediminis]|uniref:Glucose-6-phosphate 1-dehydrogenase n=1 Tax=Kineobactrum sediminis TaxID=1905677 RepID=A0A2N5XZA4_9GAMM|nr:glucose-6-phosphate dehydrogenase [Kineobactrum sediminis]PLW81474.1 glucose-6-phosphate dehydrogenase [Kineobactrum sediminis]
MSSAVDLIIFGTRGDLSRRKLFPALYQLDRAGLLEDGVRIAGLARDDISNDEFAADIEQTLREAFSEANIDDESCERFCARLQYLYVDFAQPDQYSAIKQWLASDRIAIYYLATPPSLFGMISEHLAGAGCITHDSRIVLEKPIGHDLASSRQVNDAVASCFDECNIYRIDHYLGKETVQNLLALRFANRMINSQWDNSCVDHVQITAAETVGIEGRWSYYDKVGQLRDMIQNHVLQLLCMVAMEPPNSLRADEIRAEKVKILRALSPITAATVAEQAVRGQYTAGWVNGTPVVGYLDEEGSESDSSNTETFVALKAYIDNWRWAGVPFYLRTGKRMESKVTEVVITYKDPPHAIFPENEYVACNRLIIRLQPNEGIELEMLSKKQSLKERMSLEKRHLNLDFFDSSGESRIADAYERLFLEVINGDQWLFVSREEIEASWSWCDALLDAWKEKGVGVSGYSAGSWGPSKAEMLIEKDQCTWHRS